ncbi:MAG: DUF3343 domain-containing protein [Oscillospiraceae bacterium]|nr:DUF3343 domain-containing protein [Oscillospiraceae bacterium]
MNRSFFILNSITYAMKSRDLLLHYGISANVERSRKGREKYGCGFGIYVPKRADEAEQILKKHNIRILDRTERDGAQ